MHQHWLVELEWAAYEHDNALAHTEYERSRELADRPVLCGNRLHEMTPDNIRVDPAGRRHCRACERITQRRRREQRAHRRSEVA